MKKFLGLVLGYFGYTLLSKSEVKAAIPVIDPVLNEIANETAQEYNYFGRSDLPRGIRNNNAGNLVQTAIPWNGKILIPRDDRFEQFTSPEFGLRAMMKDLINDWSKGSGTIRALINEYAPSFENDTQTYINIVADRVGVSPDTPIDLQNENTLLKLAKAIVIHENGAGDNYRAWYSDETYKRAIRMI